ncbi:hypothetical protein [Candidatus Nitrosocosmicus sp. T]
MDKIIKFGVLVLSNIGLATIFGIFLARMMTFVPRPLDKVIGRREICGFTSISGRNGIKPLRSKI